MPHGLVQQYARPTRAQHHRHHAGRRIDRVQVHQRLPQRLARQFLRLPAAQQLGVGITTAHAGIARFTATVLLHQHLHVQAHQRAHVGGEHAIASCHQHRVQASRQAHRHLLHARVRRAQETVHRAQRLDLGGVVHRVNRIIGSIQRASAATHQRTRRMRGAITGDRACRARGIQQGNRIDVVGIGETGLLARDRAHAHALFDRMGTVLDDAVLHCPALAPGVLEVEIAEIDTGAQQGAERAVQPVLVEAGGQQEAGFCKRE